MGQYCEMNCKISPLLLFCTAVACVGASMSIGGYGIYVPLLVILMIIYLWNNIKAVNQNLSIFLIQLYTAYVFVFVVCSFFNGDGNEGRNSLIINYAVCIFIFLILGQSVRSWRAIDQIIGVLIFILIFDCLITIAQYYNLTIGWSLWFFINGTDSKFAEIAENISASQVIGQSFIFCPGIFSSQVLNGYIVSSLGALALFRSLNNSNVLIRISYLAVVALTFFSLFIIQQRMAFALFLIVAVTMYYKQFPRLTIVVGILMATMFVIYGLELSETTVGRLSDFNDETRDTLYTKGLEYVLTHILTGGRLAFSEQMNLSVHNIFLNAFMYGGILGGALIMIIYFKMCFRSFRLILKNYNNHINPASALAYSLLIYNLISLTHNNSLLTGDPIIWVLYALMMQTYNIKDER